VHRSDYSDGGRPLGRSRRRSAGRRSELDASNIFAATFALSICLVLLALAVSLCAAQADAATASWSLEPSTWDFGTVVPGSGPSTPESFTLINTGEATLTPALLSLSQEGESGFKLAGNTCHSALVTGAECVIMVRFEPTLPGLQTAELSMQEVHEQVPPAVALFSGTGAGAAVELSPSTLSFGSVQVGASPSPIQTVVLANRGQLGLSISSVSVETNSFAEGDTRQQFRLAGGSCVATVVLAPDASCSVAVEFTPTQPFGTGGHLVFADNVPGSPQRVPLLGSGTAVPVPLIGHNPAPVHFPPRVETLRWSYAGTRGARILLARVDVRPCTRGSFPVIRPRVRERKTSAIVTLLGRFPAEERLEGSGCQKKRIRRIVRVRLQRAVDGLVLYDGSQRPIVRRGPIG
jgi:hypothetical protein